MAMNESGLRTFTAGEALAICRRVKLDASQNVVYADADDLGIGTTEQAASSGEAISIRLWNSPGTRKLTCADAVTAGADLYGADDGKVTDTAAADRNIVAEAIEAGSGNGAIIETILRGGSAGSPTDSLVTEALSDLSDVSGKTGTGSTVVMSTSPTIATPTLDVPAIDEFTSAQHDHADASGGGTLGVGALGITASGDQVIGMNASGSAFEAKTVLAGTNIESITHTAGAVTINGKTDPTIDDFTNATHDHADASGGGNLLSTAFYASGVTGTGKVVLDTAPTIDVPVIDEFSSAQHDHVDASGGGQLLSTAFFASGVTGSGKVVLDTTPTLDVPVIDEFTSAQHDHVDASGGGQLLSTAFFASGVTGSGKVVLDTTPTLDVPAIDEFTSAQHDHQDASGGGQLTGAALSDKTGSGTTVVLTGNPTITSPVIADLSNMTHDHTSAAEGGVISTHPNSFTQTFADHYADGTNNNCDSIREWDNTDKVVYNKITALASGAPLQSLQCIFAIQIPTGFTAWDTNAIQITYKTIDTTPYVQVMAVVDSTGTEISAGFPAAVQNAAKSTLTVTAAMLSTGTWTADTVVYVKVKGYGNTGTPFSTETACIGPVKANFA